MRLIFFLTILFGSFFSYAQNKQPGSSEIKLKLKKLNFLGSVLYVAAHPDDENTRAITYLANDRLASTAYLSMTRGDGGQNLIGPEIGELLGLIRTQELLAARRIDGDNNSSRERSTLVFLRTIRRPWRFGAKRKFFLMWFR